MLKSMTGYGRFEDTVDGYHIAFEIKSVNHKYFEFSSRITRGYSFLEDKIKAYVQNKISRGKIDVFIQIEAIDEADVKVIVNHSLASAYMSAFDELRSRYNIEDSPSLDNLIRYPEIFSVHKAPEDEEKIFEILKRVSDPAIDAFIRMRECEGTRLKNDIMDRAERIISIVDKIEDISPETVKEYENRLKTKIIEILDDNRFDDQRVLTEVAIFADKIAVAEETVRLRSHFDQLKKLIETDQPIGRKMDFLIQEMNREANTIGSKSVNSEIAYLIVDIKSEIEKIREQVQNIE